MVQIYVIDTDVFSEQQLLDKITELLPESRKIKIRSMKQEHNKALSAAAGFLFLYGLYQLGFRDFSFLNEELLIGEHGKPYLQGENQKIYFNLSHSGTKAACVISKKECGIDIERVKESRVTESLIRKVCSKKEQDILFSQEMQVRNSHFFKLWTVKESVMKKSGKGILMAPDTIEVSEMIDCNEMKMQEGFIHSFPKDMYYLSVCCEEEVCCEEDTQTLPVYVDKSSVKEFLLEILK